MLDQTQTENNTLTGQTEVKIITAIDHISDPEHFLKLVRKLL